ncbi:MAG: LytTR family DNA-binding domain-containing protein [Cyclobacteriaceae bacterium]
MKVAIIEDEIPAAEKLTRYLKKYDEGIEVAKVMRSVKEAEEWLSAYQSEVELLFMDIQLLDGLSFEIFNRMKIEKPVIFTTAHDEYAIDAFQVNGIAYLLKPVTFVALSGAMLKFRTLKEQLSNSDQQQKLHTAVTQIQNKSYKDRFLVKIRDHIHSLKASEAALFYAEGRTVYLVTNEGRRYIIDYKLEALEELLAPDSFYRVNRTFIINIEYIGEVVVYSNSRLKINMQTEIEKEIVVSRDKVNNFKAWFEGKTKEG